MAIFGSKQLNSLEDLFVWELKDLYDAEHQLTDALPKMVDAAHSPDLKKAFQKHLGQTKQQASRLEQVFTQLGIEPERVRCDGMKGLIAEAEEVLDFEGDPNVKDAGLISAAQRVEHYEIAGYGTVRTFAEQLGHQDIADMLQTILDEEGETDKNLTRLAESSINYRAHVV